MMEEKYIILNSNKEHEYTITKIVLDSGCKYILSRSDSSVWTEQAKNEELISLINDGNGVILNNSVKKLNYAELIELRLLLSFDRFLDDPSNNLGYTIINTKHLYPI
jgi:hypothetical protein